MTQRSLAILASAVISIGALAFWFYTAPAVGCGWALFISWVVVGVVHQAKDDSSIALVGSLAYTAAAAIFWYLGNTYVYAGWVGFLAIIGIFQAVQKLYAASAAK